MRKVVFGIEIEYLCVLVIICGTLLAITIPLSLLSTDIILERFLHTYTHNVSQTHDQKIIGNMTEKWFHVSTFFQNRDSSMLLLTSGFFVVCVIIYKTSKKAIERNKDTSLKFANEKIFIVFMTLTSAVAITYFAIGIPMYQQHISNSLVGDLSEKQFDYVVSTGYEMMYYGVYLAIGFGLTIFGYLLKRRFPFLSAALLSSSTGIIIVWASFLLRA